MNVKFVVLGGKGILKEGYDSASGYYDVSGYVEKVANYIAGICEKNRIRFLGKKIATSEDEVLDLDTEGADLLVVLPLSSIHVHWLHALFSKGIPMIVLPAALDEVFSHGNVYLPYFLRDLRKIERIMPGFTTAGKLKVVHSRGELAEELRAYRAYLKVVSSRILCVGSPLVEPLHSRELGYSLVRLLRERFGITVKYVSASKFIRLFREFRWDDRCERVLKEVLNRAEEVVEPRREMIKDAVRMYCLLDELRRSMGCNAVTVNCLGSQIEGARPRILSETRMTPCLALSLLNDEGIPAACEADISSMFNMLVTTWATNSPCFMANPFIFPDGRLILAHCSSPTRRSFEHEIRDPFSLRSFHGMPVGMSLLVKKEEGAVVTMTGISHLNLSRMIVTVGRIVRNTRLAPICRTQIEVEVKDVKGILENYEGRHWMVVYGDHREELKRANELLGIETMIV